MQLYLIRHGQGFVNLENAGANAGDQGLTELGRQQAAALAKGLPQEIPSIDAFYMQYPKASQGNGPRRGRGLSGL